MTGVGTQPTDAWLSELDLDPSVPWLKMGTRNLGHRPWLVFDSARDSELELRRSLLRSRPSDVLAESAESNVVAAELEEMIRDSGVAIAAGPSPLQRLAVSVQEDLCLLNRSSEGWVLRAAALCFPSRWHLRDKLNRPLLAVHGPVPGYAASLGDRVDRMIDGLADRTVLRRNWFLHPDPALFQPDRPANGDPVIAASDCADGLYVRSERQTLRLLPESGWCVFTIRIQQCTVGELVRKRPVEFGHWIDEVHDGDALHRGVSSAQRDQLVAWIAAPDRGL